MKIWQVYGNGFCLLEISGGKIYGFLKFVIWISKKCQSVLHIRNTQMFLKNSLFHFFKYFFPFYVICPLVTEENNSVLWQVKVCKVSSQLVNFGVSKKREE